LNDSPLSVVRAGELADRPQRPRWLVRPLCPHPSVIIVGAQPKSSKTWLSLDFAVSVASATPCLGHFPVDLPGPALVYLAEDSLLDVKTRLECLCKSRGLALGKLDLHVITEPALRLDLEGDQRRLREAVAQLGPRLLVLDPLVRLHRLDENSSQEISRLLGYLRELQRAHDVTILLVHHTSKKAHARHGQALRGSSDLHAWTDVGLYLTWHGDRLRLTPELRTAAAPEPFDIALVTGDPEATHLEISSPSSAPCAPTLTQRALQALRAAAPLALRRYELREALGVNNAKLGEALAEIEELGFAHRTPDGWRAADEHGQT
jgi:hypothetical protein